MIRRIPIVARIAFFAMALLALVPGIAGAAEEFSGLARPAPAPYLVFYRDDQPVARPVASTRGARSHALDPDTAEIRARDLLELWVEGPTPAERAAGWTSAIGDGAVLHDVRVEHDAVTIEIEFPSEFLAALTVTGGDRITAAVVQILATVPELRTFHIHGRAEAEHEAAFRALDAFLPELPRVPSKHELRGEERAHGPAAAAPVETPAPVQFPPELESAGLGQPPGFGQDRPPGSLTGKTLFISPGHGWYWNGATSWVTQRGNTNELVEDLHTVETVNQLLVQYLWNAGADVWTMRERGIGTSEILVDNGSGNTAGTYSESGAWFDSSLTGFAQHPAPYTSEDPFDLGGNRLLATAATPTGSAIWTFTIPADGFYPVYVSYSEYSSRAPDARYVVRHSGGSSSIRVNQTIHGFTWRYLGTFYFEASALPAQASVELWNDSASAGTYISADAVRLGGGMGNIDRGSGISGWPRFEECSRYFAQYQGAPPSVYQSLPADNDADVTARPRYSEFERDPAEIAAYISLHTNAPNPGSGTSTYIYDGGATAGSVQLQSAIHDELINDIRNGWDPAWTDRGKLQANFGEVRLLSTMPGTLIELAFHDTPADAADLKEAKFRLLSARAIAQGIIKYFAAAATLPPEPPENLLVIRTGNGSVRLQWNPSPTDGSGVAGHAATSYKVYRSTNGRGFDSGTTTSATFLDVTGLASGQVYYFRVSGRNAGGESFPTPTLAARVSASPARLLLVDGFDRIDAAALIPQYEGASLGTVKRMVLERMNRYDYAIAHAQAAAAAGIDFVSASNEAVASGALALADYCGVDWIVGEESSSDDTFSAAEQALVSAYLAAGGSLFVSGAEIGWDLDALNNGRPFYQNDLKSIYRDDDPYTGAGTPANLVSGIAGGIFAGLSGIFFDNGTADIYNCDYPDAIGPNAGALQALSYQGSAETYTGAAVSYQSPTGTSRVVNFGFPFETVVAPADRQNLMARVLQFFTFTTPVTLPAVNLMVTKSAGNLTLVWGAAPNAQRYRVYRAASATGPFDGSTDVTASDGDGSATDLAYTETGGAAPGGVWFYQVTGENCAGEGPR